MKKLWLLCLIGIPFLVAQSQAPLPAGFEHWTAADLQVVNKTLAAKAAGDSHRAASTPLSDCPNELFMLAHREADGQPELHETQADVLVVESQRANHRATRETQRDDSGRHAAEIVDGGHSAHPREHATSTGSRWRARVHLFCHQD